jgi:hypothetical protein
MAHAGGRNLRAIDDEHKRMLADSAEMANDSVALVQYLRRQIEGAALQCLATRRLIAESQQLLARSTGIRVRR